MVRTTRVMLAAVLGGCTVPPAPVADSLERLFADSLTVVDLTHEVSADAPFWPGPERSPFVHDTLRAHPDGTPAMAAYAVPEHFGTHFDAPVHAAMGLASVDRVPVRELFGPAVVLDVTATVADDPDYAVTGADIEAWEAEHGRIPAGAIVIARTGWSRKWNDGAAYYALDADGRLHFPGFGEGAARLLIENRDIAGIGIDTGSVDPGNANGFPVHGIVNGSGHFHLENLADLSALPASGAYLIVAPIKIRGGSGGQVRVFAIVP